jgi:hypothetical protein
MMTGGRMYRLYVWFFLIGTSDDTLLEDKASDSFSTRGHVGKCGNFEVQREGV